MIMVHRRSTAASFLEVFSLNPLPYPVLLFLGVICIFLGLQSYVSYESVVETAEVNLGWIMFAVPVVLIFLVRALSSMDSPERFFWGTSPWDRHRRMQYFRHPEGSSPWGVAAVILLLIVLLQFQSTFLDSWFI
ncbi:uncharacterized protein LOC113762030 [Coffea eugenioides]|uniref:Uncharacterized protein n=1 Tax=Coffea arabica TaxID=13443 RepID=A0A6P6W9Z6_COFAR|nr:uncharacterized protein LOC113762030 [Coffea eugenioides]